jgi:hypothetical protein
MSNPDDKLDIDEDTALDMIYNQWNVKRSNLGVVCLDIIETYGMDQTTCDQLIIDAWALTENPYDQKDIWDILWDDYYLLRLKDQQDVIQSKILPNTKVYRGGNSKHGRSWTLDINVAHKFCERNKYLRDPNLEHPEDKIWEKTIQPEDVLAYIDIQEIDGLSEQEVVLTQNPPEREAMLRS